MSEANKELVRRTWDQLFNQGNLAAADENIAPNAVFPSAAPGVSPDLEGFKGMVATNRVAFPDIRVEFEEQVAEGDKMASRLRIRGTHKGELAGIAPTGKEMDIEGFNLITIRGGKIVEIRGMSDQFRMMQQIGAVPS
jgi:predicted ester cyclase